MTISKASSAHLGAGPWDWRWSMKNWAPVAGNRGLPGVLAVPANPGKETGGAGPIPQSGYHWAGLAVYAAMKGLHCMSVPAPAFCGPGTAPQITHVFLCKGNCHPSKGRRHSSHR